MSGRIVLAVDRVGNDLRPESAILAPLDISIEYPSENPAHRSHQFQHAEGILLNRTVVNDSFLRTVPSCRVIVTYGVGHDHIDVDAARRRHVIVAHVPDYCTEEVADHTMALFLTLARGICRSDALVRAGAWGLDGIGSLHRLRGRVMGLIGFGRIARAVASRAAAFGLDIFAYDPAFSSAAEPHSNVRLLPSLSELLSASDIVSLHLPLSARTQGLIDEKALRHLKPGAILINTSRGGLVELHALLEALNEGRLAGAGLDVFPEEPPDSEHLAHPNLVLTPHMAYYSMESQEELKISAARAVAAALTGLPVANLLTALEMIDKELVG